MIKKLAAIAFLVPSLANAQEEIRFLMKDDALGLIKGAHISVSDQVSGNCWTNSDVILQKSRLTLEQNGIHVYPELMEASFPVVASIKIEGLGLRTEGVRGCVGVATLSVSEIGGRYIGDTFLIGTTEYFEKQSLFVSGDTVNQQFSEFFEGGLAELTADILSARRKPNVIEVKKINASYLNPSSMKTFEETMREINSPTNN